MNDWKPISTPHPDLPLSYWTRGGDLFWESRWFSCRAEALCFLEEASGIPEAAEDSRHRDLCGVAGEMMTESIVSDRDGEVKFLYWGRSDQLFFVFRAEDDEEDSLPEWFGEDEFRLLESERLENCLVLTAGPKPSWARRAFQRLRMAYRNPILSFVVPLLMGFSIACVLFGSFK